MKNTELVKILIKDTEAVAKTFDVAPFGTFDEFKKEIFEALVKLTAERGIERWHQTKIYQRELDGGCFTFIHLLREGLLWVGTAYLVTQFGLSSWLFVLAAFMSASQFQHRNFNLKTKKRKDISWVKLYITEVK